jgi:hypothetical protein
MRKIAFLIGILSIAFSVVAGFKAKNVKPKRPEQYQVRTVVPGVTLAADLLLEGKEQGDFFFKELISCHLIAVRLAIFNNSGNEIVLPAAGIRLIDPSGSDLRLVSPREAAVAVLQGFPVRAEKNDNPPVQVSPARPTNPRLDRTSPNYDPRLDPADPSADSRRSSARAPGVDVVLNPDRGNTSISAQLIEKDFENKAYVEDPIAPSMTRDRFLYFSIGNLPANPKGFELHLPSGQGLPGPTILKF